MSRRASLVAATTLLLLGLSGLAWLHGGDLKQEATNATTQLSSMFGGNGAVIHIGRDAFAGDKVGGDKVSGNKVAGDRILGDKVKKINNGTEFNIREMRDFIGNIGQAQTKTIGGYFLKHAHRAEDVDFWDKTMEPYLRRLKPALKSIDKFRELWVELGRCTEMRTRADKICALMAATKSMRRLQGGSHRPVNCNEECSASPCSLIACCPCIAAHTASCLER